MHEHGFSGRVDLLKDMLHGRRLAGVECQGFVLEEFLALIGVTADCLISKFHQTLFCQRFHGRGDRAATKILERHLAPGRVEQGNDEVLAGGAFLELGHGFLIRLLAQDHGFACFF